MCAQMHTSNTHVGQWKMLGSLPYSFETGSLNLELGWRPADPSDPISAQQSTGLQMHTAMLSLLCGCRSFKLKSLCLFSNISLPEPLPSPDIWVF